MAAWHRGPNEIVNLSYNRLGVSAMDDTEQQTGRLNGPARAECSVAWKAALAAPLQPEFC
jgi:hypothetical protein